MWIFSAAVALAATAHGQTPTLVDARTAIAEIGAHDPETRIERAEAAFADDLKEFPHRNAKRNPKQVAEAWLALLDEAIALPHRSMNGGLGGAPPRPVGTLENVLIDLPGPDAWPQIAALAAQRPPSLDRSALLLLCARLQGDDEQVLKLCEEFDRQKPPRGYTSYVPSQPSRIRFAALRRLGRLSDPNDVAIGLGASEEAQSSFPRLLDLLPEAAARQAILHYLKTQQGWPLRNPQNRKLAQQVVIEHGGDFKEAPWALAEGNEDLPFVRAMVERYGFANMFDGNNQGGNAAKIYFLDLLRRRRTEEAAKFIASAGDRLPDIQPEDWNPPRDADQFVLQLQTQVPTADLAGLYVGAAVASGRTAEAIQFLRTQIHNPGTSEPRRIRLFNALFDLDARIGDLKGLAADWDLAEHFRKPGGPDPGYAARSVATASGDADLIARALAVELHESPPWAGGPAFQALLRQRRFAELESMVLTEAEKSGPAENWPTEPLRALCVIYYRANRPLDILALLKNYPYWPGNDVSDIGLAAGPPYGGGNEREDDDQSIAFYAAWALGRTNGADLAVRLLRNLLLFDPRQTPGYRLLNEVGGAPALAVYRDLIRAHPCNAYPVVWLADLQLRLGHVAEAETAVRQAMRIDPVGATSYRGELVSLQGRIRAKLGDRVGASQFARRAEAIRLAERGEQLLQARLLASARPLIEHAVGLWPDDAALQAELADCLHRLCRPEEAASHLRRAYAALPAALGESSEPSPKLWLLFHSSEGVSFGREVLDVAIRERPNDPETWYARAELEDHFGYSGAAASDFQKCLKLDPHHAGALIALEPLTRGGLLTPTQASEVEFRLIELDPDQPFMRGFVDLASVRNLDKAFRALQTAWSALPVFDDQPILPIPSGSPPGPPTPRRFPFMIVPDFDRLDPDRRNPGFVFQRSDDVAAIAHLYHPTGFPFE